MSLELSHSDPVVTAKTALDDNVCLYNLEKGIDIDIPMSDFCCLIEYVLTNTDLQGLNDPRIDLIFKLKTAKVGPGHNALIGNKYSHRIHLD
jgi:hypothetical protein